MFLQTQLSFLSKKKDYCSEYIKIWGVVKYYNPSLKNYIPKLDSAFQTDIKDILAKNNRNTFNKSVEQLLKYANTSFDLKTSSKIIPRVMEMQDSINGWIFLDRNLTSRNQKEILRLIHANRDSINPFVKNNPDNNGAVFTNEKSYISLFPSTELRLLALARYWNVINYFFPYKPLMTVDWSSTLNSFTKELIDCKNELAFHQIIVRLCALINDGHGTVSSYPMEKHYGFSQLPIIISYIDNKLLVTKIHKTALNLPFKFGDILLKVNQKTFEEFYKEDSIYIRGTNINRKKNISANNFISSNEGKISEVQIMRNDSVIDFLVPSLSISSISDKQFSEYKPTLDSCIGENYIYVDISKIDSTDFERLILLHNKPYIIVDLRSYPNWMLNQIADLFASTKTPFAGYYFPDISNPGLFTTPILLYLNPKRTDNKAKYKQIILLVNYTTLSSGEFLCMAFQALPNVITVGNQTAGADGNVTQILLPGNIVAKFSGLGIQYPNGMKSQQDGVKIDLYYANKGSGISSGIDEELAFILNTLIEKGKN